jgi:dCMP deaminase
MKDENGLYLAIARQVANQSYAKRMQVGAVIVKDNRIISIGYNGMPAGWDNTCEYEFVHPQTKIPEIVTKPEVLHAETNAIAKVAKSSESSEGATLYTTCAPCLQCAKLIYQSGIKRVIFGHRYRNDEGISFLERAGLDVEESADYK